MANNAKPPISWHQLSRSDRWKRLDTVMRVWYRLHRNRRTDNVRGRTVHLDGSCINDVPSFYLALGEAVNGPNGYFGCNLDVLDECLFGGFGVVPPLTIRLSHFEAVRSALDCRATIRQSAERYYNCLERGESMEEIIDTSLLGDGSEEEIERLTALYKAALNDEPVECHEFGSYFDKVLNVFASHGVTLVPDNEEV